jgi:hypothetical protein
MTTQMEKSDSQRLVAEAVWLPTYAGVCLLLLSTLNDGIVADIVVLGAMLGCRIALEFTFRVAFGEARLAARTQFLAFGLQLVIWSLIWFWHFQKSTSIG